MSDVNTGVNPTMHAQFRLSSVIHTTFFVFLRRFFSFLILALVFMSAPEVLVTLLGKLLPEKPTLSFNLFGDYVNILDCISYIFIFTMYTFGNAVIIYGALQEIQGQSLNVRHSLKAASQRIIPLACVVLLAALAMALAFLFLIVPGFIVICVFYVAIPVCLIEKQGVIDSLQRSAALTKGYRWEIFFLIMFSGIISGIVYFAFPVVVPPILHVFNSKIVVVLLHILLTSIIAPIGTILIAAAYYYLRIAKEGSATGDSGIEAPNGDAKILGT